MKILRVLPLALLITASAFAQQNNLGEFTVDNPGGKIVLENSPRVIQATLSGPAATIKSRQEVRELELSAQKIWGTSDRTGKNKNLLTRSTLTGKVRIRITELATGNIDIVTAERVEYKIGEAKGTGHADLVGKTTWKRLDKARQPILTFTGVNGTIDFEGDSQRITLYDLNANVNPPANKEKGKQ